MTFISQKLNFINKNIHWIFFTSLFFFLIAPNLLREGMFVDGIWYAAISNNLENDIGEFWLPSFTTTIYNSFYEHPPLVFWLQSLFFKIFGQSFWVERIYCLVIFLLTAYIISKIWKQIYLNNKNIAKLHYLPLILWILNFHTFFAYPNNVLECTLTLFTLASIYFLNKSLEYKGLKAYILMLISGLLIFFGFLSKGFVALFPIVFFAILYIVYRKNLKIQLQKSIFLCLSFTLFFIILMCFESPRNFMNNYLNNQVIDSLSGNRVENMRENRFYIFNGIFKALPISLGLSLCILILTYHFNKRIIPKNDKIKTSFVFLLIGISSSIPLMISLKQAGYYLVPSTPYYMLSLSIFVAPSFYFLKTLFNKNKKLTNSLSVLISGILIISFILAITNIGTIDKRNKEQLANIKAIVKVIPNYSTINFKAVKIDNSVIGFYQRYKFISLDTLNISQRNFLVIEKNIDTINNSSYKKIFTKSLNFNVYKKLIPTSKK